MSQRWLFKEEPSSYSFADLVEDGGTDWDGVRNNLALKHMRQAVVGDEVFYYHTGRERAIVGIARISEPPRPDPDEDDPRIVVLGLQPVRELERPVTLAELKEDEAFGGSPLLRIPRLSVMPVTDAQWEAVLRRARS